MEIKEIMVVLTGIMMMIEVEWTEDLVMEDSEVEMMEALEEETEVVVISVIEEVDQTMVTVSNAGNLAILLETVHKVVTLVTEEETGAVLEEVVVIEEATMVDTEVVVITMTTEENLEVMIENHLIRSGEGEIEVVMMGKVNILPVEEVAAAAWEVEEASIEEEVVEDSTEIELIYKYLIKTWIKYLLKIYNEISLVWKRILLIKTNM